MWEIAHSATTLVGYKAFRLLPECSPEIPGPAPSETLSRLCCPDQPTKKNFLHLIFEHTTIFTRIHQQPHNKIWYWTRSNMERKALSGIRCSNWRRELPKQSINWSEITKSKEGMRIRLNKTSQYTGISPSSPAPAYQGCI